MSELELVLKAVESLGDSGLSAFLWWVASDFFESLLTAGTFVAMFAFAYFLTKYIFNETNRYKDLASQYEANYNDYYNKWAAVTKENGKLTAKVKKLQEKA